MSSCKERRILIVGVKFFSTDYAGVVKEYERTLIYFLWCGVIFFSRNTFFSTPSTLVDCPQRLFSSVFNKFLVFSISVVLSCTVSRAVEDVLLQICQKTFLDSTIFLLQVRFYLFYFIHMHTHTFIYVCNTLLSSFYFPNIYYVRKVL